MAATKLNNGDTAITSHMLADQRYAGPDAGALSDGASSGAGRENPTSSGWGDPTGAGATDANHPSGSWVQGANQSKPNVTLPADGGSYTPAKLVVFGDLLSDNGNAAAVEESLGETPSYVTAPYDSNGDFSDGPKWTTDLAHSLGLNQPSQQENLAYAWATAVTLGEAASQVNPAGGLTPLATFAGQIQQFEQGGGAFSPSDVVSVTFGGNDIFSASALALAGAASAEQVVTDSVNAIIVGLEQLGDLGAKHFLVSNSPDLTLAPIFSSAEFLASGATVAGVQGLVNDFNTQLAAGLGTVQSQTGLDVKTLDLHTLFNNVAATPSDHGFTNVTQPVLSSIPGTGSTPATFNPAINGQNPQVEHGSLFLDPLFDTTERGQMLIAQAAHGTLMG